MSGELQIFSGNANPALAHEICAYLGTKLGEATVGSFSDGEIRVKIEENVRGGDVFVVQSSCQPVNDSLMELLIIIDALKRSSANRITAVIPYFGYARQDRKDQPRVPISAKLVADLISTAGTDRVLTMDLHAGQIQGFFNLPVDHLYALPVLLDYITKKKVSDLVVVSPDAGGVERARAFAKRLEASLAIIDKRREGPESDADHEHHRRRRRQERAATGRHDRHGRHHRKGGAGLYGSRGSGSVGACTHAVLTGPALSRIQQSCLKQVIVTNWIPLRGKEQLCPKLRQLSVAPLLGEAIRRIHEDESVSSLFL